MLDHIQTAGVSFRQGVVTLHSVSHAENACFFVPYIQLLTDRGGASTIQHPLWGRLARRSMAVTNTPIVLVGNQLSKSIGGSL